MLISGIYQSISFLKPFNPFWGETYQAEICDETGDKSLDLYVEQTCHHPPISHFLVEEVNSLYKISGFYEHKFDKEGFSKVIVWNEGPSTIEFEDGEKITYTLPSMEIQDSKFMKFTGEITIDNKAQDLEAFVRLDGF